MDIKKLKVPEFDISIDYQGKSYRMQVKQIRLDLTREIFSVSAGMKTKFIESWRPYTRLNEGKSTHYMIRAAHHVEIKDYEALRLVIAEIVKVITFVENNC